MKSLFGFGAILVLTLGHSGGVRAELSEKVKVDVRDSCIKGASFKIEVSEKQRRAYCVCTADTFSELFEPLDFIKMGIAIAAKKSHDYGGKLKEVQRRCVPELTK